MHTFKRFIILCALSLVASTQVAPGNEDTDAPQSNRVVESAIKTQKVRLQKNDFRKEALTFFQKAGNNAATITSPLNNFFIKVFKKTLPKGSVLIEANLNELPLLQGLLERNVKEKNILMPTVYFSDQDNAVNARFVTFNDRSAILIPRGAFMQFSTNRFDRYHADLIGRISAYLATHSRLSSLNNKKAAALVAASLLSFLGGIVTNELGVTTKEFGYANIATYALFAASALSGALATNYCDHEPLTHSFGELDSLRELPGAQELKYPSSVTGVLEPEYIHNPGYLTKAELKIRNFLAKKNAEELEMKKLEEAEEEEFLRAISGPNDKGAAAKTDIPDFLTPTDEDLDLE